MNVIQEVIATHQALNTTANLLADDNNHLASKMEIVSDAELVQAVADGATETLIESAEALAALSRSIQTLCEAMNARLGLIAAKAAGGALN